ncbi:MAG: nucleotide exchange factor GrpE [Parcubacteria group bacterium RIFOXYD2_FULL_52_8]|nr:MAG: nucleotide exchange factor GrpE [Parcubacteria group bacterium RIFOXYD2_FULL_52_8]
MEDEAEENAPQATIKKLREQLKVCQKERQEYLEGWQRAKADFVNARKEEERQRSELRQYAKADLLEEILPIVDNFERAMSNKEVWERVEQNWRVGVEYIYAQLLQVLADHGLEPFAKAGDTFDPARHQSTEAVPTASEAEDDTIASVLERGYMYNSRIIRPARVKVWHYTHE